MLKKILRDVVVVIAGKQAEGIVELLVSNQHVNEFLIAKKLNITINQTRNILYKISDRGLVSFVRKKDKKKGWYTYFWKIEPIKALEFYKSELLAKIDQINHQIKNREARQFYYCQLCHIEVNEETALLRDFTCPECGNVYSLLDNIPIIHDLKKGLNKLYVELNEVEQEIKIELEKLSKVKKVKIQPKAKTKQKKAKLHKDIKIKKGKFLKIKPRVKSVKKTFVKSKKITKPAKKQIKKTKLKKKR
jgi:transcription factor E